MPPSYNVFNADYASDDYYGNGRDYLSLVSHRNTLLQFAIIATASPAG